VQTILGNNAISFALYQVFYKTFVNNIMRLRVFQQPLLCSNNNFLKIVNGKYFVEWDCGADLSADTIEAHLKIS